jgi:hypothetical protein
MLPFLQKQISNSSFTRTFNSLVNEDELKWHFDEKDRTVTVLQNDNWHIQGTIHIPKNTYHRIIRGQGELKVLINEN